MDVTDTARRRIAGLTAALCLFGAGVALAPVASATTWCPGDPKPAVEPWPDFYETGCHNYEGTAYGLLDLDTGIIHPFAELPPAPAPEPNWCPGDPIPGGFAPEAVNWDHTVCHVATYVADPGNLLMQDDGNNTVVAGDLRHWCPIGARLSPMPCL